MQGLEELKTKFQDQRASFAYIRVVRPPCVPPLAKPGRNSDPSAAPPSDQRIAEILERCRVGPRKGEQKKAGGWGAYPAKES